MEGRLVRMREPDVMDGAPGDQRGNRVSGALEFLREEPAGGVALLLATIAALVWANVAPASYAQLWGHHLQVGYGSAAIDEDLTHWVNDGLMAVFFFTVSLEIKRELVEGELQDRRRAALPAFGALGGMVVPALVYLAVTVGGTGGETRGWGIPTATDIAFALAVLALLGRRVPTGLKVLLLSIAIVDDVGAIVIIAVFYSAGLSLGWAGVALLALGAVVGLRSVGVRSPLAFVPVALVLWIGVFESGVHATIAGVALGLLTPAGVFRGRRVLDALEHRLTPIATFVVLPLFALANAGVRIDPESLRSALDSRVFWGIACGLVVGKALGLSIGLLVALRLGIGALPDGVRRAHLVALAPLGGIGFTVSLFIAGLSFPSGPTSDAARLAILGASIGAGAIGALTLGVAPGRRPPSADDPSIAR